MSSPIPMQPRSPENFGPFEPFYPVTNGFRKPELTIVRDEDIIRNEETLRDEKPRNLLDVAIHHHSEDVGPISQQTIRKLGRIHERNEVVPAILTAVILHCAGVEATEHERIELRREVIGLADRYDAAYKDPRNPKSNEEISKEIYDTTEHMTHPLLGTVDSLLKSNLSESARQPAKIIRFALLSAGIRQPTEDVQ